MKKLLPLAFLGLVLETISFLVNRNQHVDSRWKPVTYDGPLNWFRGSFMENLHGVSRDASALVAGLAIGDTSMLSESLNEQMKTVSLTHLTAVSGANCAIVVGLVYLVVSRFPVTRTTRVLIAIAALVFYVMLVGPQPSVLRAGVMTGVVLLLVALGRGVQASYALAASATVLLIFNPWLAVDFGFQLSVLATLGILEIAPELTRKLNKYFPSWLSLGLAVSVAAQLVCLPVLLQLQPGLSTYSIPANILSEPLVAPITVLGILACLFAPFMPWLSVALSWVASLGTWLIAALAAYFARLPTATIGWASGALGITLSAGVALAMFIWLRSRNWRVRHISAIGLGLVCAVTIGGCAAQGTRDANWASTDWSVVSCDVGQGDATLIRSQGLIALIDVGRKPGPISSCLQRLGVTQIDFLVLTHYDMDHVGGLSGVTGRLPIKQALITGFRDTRPAAAIAFRDLERFADSVAVAESGMHGQLGEFAWQVLSPHHDATEAEDSNDGSVTMLFRSVRLNLLTLADLGERGQMRLAHESATWLGTGLGPAPLVVKVSHHGSSDQYAELYEELRPEIALLSVGAGNDYGHPTNRTISMLERSGAQIFRTDLDGNLSVSFGSVGLRVSAAGHG